ADKAARRTGPPAQVVGVRLTFLGRVKDKPEEGLALVTRQIRPIRGAHHAVAKAVHRALKLNGDERFPGLVEFPSIPEDVVDPRLADEERQELMEDYPLVMPPGEPAGFAEHLV